MSSLAATLRLIFIFSVHFINVQITAGLTQASTATITTTTITTTTTTTTTTTAAPEWNYKEECNGTSAADVCKDTNAVCISYQSSSQKKCLCKEDFYMTVNHGCVSVDQLKVNASSNRSTTSITFSWADNSGGNNVTYCIICNGTSFPASKTGGIVTDLAPGTQYNCTVNSTLNDPLYPAYTEESTNYILWTKPAKPGNITSVELESSSPQYVYKITFGESKGNKNYYKIEVTAVTDGASQNKISNSTNVRFSLTPSAQFKYFISSVSDNLEESDPNTGSFETNPTVPGPVENLNATEVLDFKASITWQRPSNTNGNMRGYLVNVINESGDCVYYIKVKCNNCTEPFDNNDARCSLNETANITNNNNEDYKLELPRLEPYHNYTVMVTAVNVVGPGESKDTNVKTLVGAANQVLDISLISTRNERTKKVNLIISWTPGKLTGPTTYHILVGKTGLGTENYTTEGYSSTTKVVDDVIAFWNYSVTIWAKTSKGPSTAKSQQNMTVESNPGLVQNLTVKQDSSMPAKVTVTFLCPAEQQRNGKIIKFIICESLLDDKNKSDGCKNHTVTATNFCNENTFIIDIELEKLARNYTFAVMAVSNNYNGNFGEPFFIQIIPGASNDHKTGVDNKTGAIIGGVLGGLAFIIIVVCIILFLIWCYRRHLRKTSSHTDCEMSAVVKKIKQKRPVKLRGFGDHVARFHKDSNRLFQDEFEDIQALSKALTFTCEHAMLEQNRIKTRYTNIIPYDHSRVKLDILQDDDETTDFINANYIPGYNSVREYIATQGPMYSTIPHFWRMVWEQKCKVIIMLSDLMEEGKRKVDMYWPENLNEPINYEHVVVEMINYLHLEKYFVRNFRVTKGDKVQMVTHFFLHGWLDHRDFDPDVVLDFCKLYRQELNPSDSRPILVHCSAGVGRTGTLIALDYFIQFVEKHSLDDEVDIFGFVMQMRRNRCLMVQAESQYILIYDAINKLVQQKIKFEEERIYENTGSNGVYANLVQDGENIYENTGINTGKYVFSNEAFEPDNSNIENKDNEKPNTES